ncbi:MAG: hypothetical protein EHM43_00695 [Ignavibacteriae bacterium]|nr:MAG: hypothetical protein EHM43_00695 [Ignavibacteriota bacterium]
MNIAAIKALVETYDDHQLQQAEAALMEGNVPEITIQGEDEGEQLTHVLAALWVIQNMKSTDDDLMTSIRAYTKRVRTSIS